MLGNVIHISRSSRLVTLSTHQSVLQMPNTKEGIIYRICVRYIAERVHLELLWDVASSVLWPAGQAAAWGQAGFSPWHHCYSTHL